MDIADSAAFRKGAELRENLAEKWETSDHPLVHKVEDVKERLFAQARGRTWRWRPPSCRGGGGEQRWGRGRRGRRPLSPS